ncbi:hypothetical protein [Comamonas sp.]|uniref:hypothetical protein n=1 Tax=Comamonas sp. TaxID=34028 RepID=UPI0028A17A08|nr:hypothetical protein [Comamonas sp.]
MATAKILPGNFIADAPKYEDDDGEDSPEDLKDRLDGRGEPPHNGGMEARLTALEAFAQDAKDRLTRVETKLDHIEKEVGQVKWWIIAQIVAGIVAVLGTGIAIQQMTVATFQGAAQVAKDATPSAPAAAQQPPIIINVPSSAPPASKK